MFKKLWQKITGTKPKVEDTGWEDDENCVQEIPYVAELEHLPTVHVKKKKAPKKAKKKVRKSKRKLLQE